MIWLVASVLFCACDVRKQVGQPAALQAGPADLLPHTAVLLDHPLGLSRSAPPPSLDHGPRAMMTLTLDELLSAPGFQEG